MLNYTISEQYDYESGEWVENIEPPKPAIYRGLAAVLAKAAELEIDSKVAVQSRLRFLSDRKKELERKEWGCWRQAERIGCGPINFTRISDIGRVLREHQVITKYNAITVEIRVVEAEIETLTSFLNNRKRKVIDNSITEDQKNTAHRADVRMVLEAADIKVRGNGMLKCPFHKDRAESASIAKGVLVCFAGCTPGEESTKRYWDAVALYRRLFEVDYFSAVRGVLSLV